MTHRISVKLAESERPIAGSETATMFELSMIGDETSEPVRRNGKLPDAAKIGPGPASTL